MVKSGQIVAFAPYAPPSLLSCKLEPPRCASNFGDKKALEDLFEMMRTCAREDGHPLARLEGVPRLRIQLIAPDSDVEDARSGGDS